MTSAPDGIEHGRSRGVPCGRVAVPEAAVVRLLVPIAVLASLWLVSLVAAQSLGGGRTLEAPWEWRAVIAADGGFGLLLPPSHDVSRSGSIWYVHGWFGEEPQVPDMTISFLSGVTAEEAIRRDFPANSRREEVELGPATVGLLVRSSYEAPDGSPYESTSYLVETSDGVFRIDRYESFDWPEFSTVARSFHLPEILRGEPLP